MWSDGAQPSGWLENGDGADDAVYAYDLESGERVEDREFELDQTNRAPRGVWSDRIDHLGLRQRPEPALRARPRNRRAPSGLRDIDLAERNRDGRGIWSDEVTMWVLDGVKDSLFAYDLASGELLAEYALDSTNDDPHGLWSDGVAFWVSNHDPRRLFAYRLPVPDGEEPAEGEDEADEVESLERVRNEEFDKLSRASNNSPRGIWSDGDVMYVVDGSDGKVYTYNMPDAIEAQPRLADPERPRYRRVRWRAHRVCRHPRRGGSRRRPSRPQPCNGAPNSPSTRRMLTRRPDGHQVALEGATEITVTVTSADGSRTKTYRVTVRRPEVEMELAPTWTSIEWPGADGVTIAGALQDGDIGDKVLVVYHWDEATASWRAFFPRPRRCARPQHPHEPGAGPHLLDRRGRTRSPGLSTVVLFN